MAGPKVRADYEQLKEAANGFSVQAQAAQQTVQSLQKELAVLQGGDWVGLGATAFYQEMGGQVMPAMKRLAAALESARETTVQISQVIGQAEADAARVLRGEGGDLTVLFGVAAGAVGGSSALFGAAAGPPSGSGTGAAGGATARQGPAARPQTLADAIDRMVAQDNAAVDRRLAQFSQGVRDLVKKSPTLKAQIFKLDQEKFTIRVGAPGSGNFTNQAKHLINIDQGGTDEGTAAMIAHEVGHTVNQEKFPPYPMRLTREEYVQGSVDAEMRNEGRAQINAAIVRAEVNAVGGPDIGIPGTQTADFQQVYDDFRVGKTSYDQAVDRNAVLMANEHVSVPPGLPYRQHYRNEFEFDWDTRIDEPLPPPRKP
jgi:WXG100 family type VII secretion target